MTKSFFQLVWVLVSLINFSCFAEPATAHRSKAPANLSRQSIEKEASFTGFAKGRWSDGKFQYIDNDGNWKEAAFFYRADKDGVFLNQEGDSVDYSKGDILFKTTEFGWFKAKKDSPTVTLEDNPALPNPNEVSLSEVERLVIQFTNEERIKRGLQPLRISNQLQELSRQKAKNMARSQNLSHSVAPTPPGGENIAWNQATAQEVVRSWMNSSGHRANILNPRYSVIGASVANGNGPYWAQMFQ